MSTKVMKKINSRKNQIIDRYLLKSSSVTDSFMWHLSPGNH